MHRDGAGIFAIICENLLQISGCWCLQRSKVPAAKSAILCQQNSIWNFHRRLQMYFPQILTLCHNTRGFHVLVQGFLEFLYLACFGLQNWQSFCCTLRDQWYKRFQLNTTVMIRPHTCFTIVSQCRSDGFTCTTSLHSILREALNISGARLKFCVFLQC